MSAPAQRSRRYVRRHVVGSQLFSVPGPTRRTLNTCTSTFCPTVRATVIEFVSELRRGLSLRTERAAPLRTLCLSSNAVQSGQGLGARPFSPRIKRRSLPPRGPAVRNKRRRGGNRLDRHWRGRWRLFGAPNRHRVHGRPRPCPLPAGTRTRPSRNSTDPRGRWSQ
jgi:hypothetical protein